MEEQISVPPRLTKLYESGATLAVNLGVLVSKMWESIEAPIQASSKTARIPMEPYPVYPSSKSWDEVPGKMSSGKKFFHNAISGADFGAQPYYVANVPISSKQQLVDSGTVDPGCNGELTAEGSYLYTATDGTCSLSGCQVDLNDCVNDVQVNSLQYCSGQDEINDTVSKSFIRVDVPLVRSSCSSVGEMTCTSSGDSQCDSFLLHRIEIG